MLDSACEFSRIAWEQAFRWLAAHECAQTAVVEAPLEDQFLRDRTKTLAVLSNLLSHSDVDGLPKIIAAWNEKFGAELRVPLSELRRVAREALSIADDDLDVDDLWQRAVRLSQGAGQQSVLLPRRQADTNVPNEFKRSCAEGLQRWFRELQTNPLWNTLPGILPGEPDRPLTDVYVELFAVEDAEVVQQDGIEAGKRSWPPSPARLPAIDVESMAARTLERCVIVGDPGSGKSTLVKWLVWATFHGRLADFDVAIEVKLSTFAAALAIDSKLRPLEYFFRLQGQNAMEAEGAALAFRAAARASQRFLLLLDGWDEVPVAQRAAVKECLLQEEPGLITLITSRPSGMPRQLILGRRVGCYRIAGLTPVQSEELTTKLLRQMKHPQGIPAIWQRIRDDQHLREMAANPFLLGLLVRTLMEPAADGLSTKAAVYRRIAASLREQYELHCGRKARLTTRHMEGLAELSYQLLNDPQTPRYLFTRRELERSLPGLDVEPILHSRFVTKPISVLDEFIVLHATIQEFLAAEHLADDRPEVQHAFMERAFVSVSRFIVLEFLAGMRGTVAADCQTAARHWWQSQDRFLQIAIRIARLATAGDWPLDDLGRALRETLWAEISKDQDEDFSLCQLAVQTFAALDMADLILRVRSRPLSSFALNCLIETIPASVARDQRLDQLLPGNWQDVAGLDWMGGATEAERTELQARLKEWSVSAEDLRETVMQVGASGDESAIPLLVEIVTSETLATRVREEAVTSLGRIGGLPAVHALLDLILDRQVPPEMTRMAAMAFVQQSSLRLRLDPRGRDRVLRRLAAIPPSHWQVSSLLMILEHLAIREGAEVIAELATSSQATREVNHQAILTLQLATDRQLLGNLTKWIEGRPHELTLAWLELAWERSLPIPVPWLQHRVTRCQSDREQERLLRVLLQVVAQSDGDIRNHAVVFLDLLVLKSLRREAPELQVARALAAAVNEISPRRIILFSAKSQLLAINLLSHALDEGASCDKQQLLLAVALVRHFRDTRAMDALRTLLERIYVPGKFVDDTRDYQLFYEVGECLAELAPVELLRLPAECPGVKWALRSRTLKEGWLVYADQILNAEGAVIATIVPSESTARSPADAKPSPRPSPLEIHLKMEDQQRAEFMKAVFAVLKVPLNVVGTAIDRLYAVSGNEIADDDDRFYFRVAVFRELLLAVKPNLRKVPAKLTTWEFLRTFLKSARSELRRLLEAQISVPDELWTSPSERNRQAEVISGELPLVECLFGSFFIVEKTNTFAKSANDASTRYGELVAHIRQHLPAPHAVSFGRPRPGSEGQGESWQADQ